MATPSEKCGWALVSLSTPWVAQRVWPMPMVPSTVVLQTALEVDELALGAAAGELAALVVATPAES